MSGKRLYELYAQVILFNLYLRCKDKRIFEQLHHKTQHEQLAHKDNSNQI